MRRPPTYIPVDEPILARDELGSGVDGVFSRGDYLSVLEVRPTSDKNIWSLNIDSYHACLVCPFLLLLGYSSLWAHVPLLNPSLQRSSSPSSLMPLPDMWAFGKVRVSMLPFQLPAQLLKQPHRFRVHPVG